MRPLLNLLLFCCKGTKEEDLSVNSTQETKDLENIEKKTVDPKQVQLDPTSNISEVKIDAKEDQEKILLRPSKHKPSIILSMDGSSHQVVLFEDNAKPNKKKPKKRRKKHGKRSKHSEGL